MLGIHRLTRLSRTGRVLTSVALLSVSVAVWSVTGPVSAATGPNPYAPTPSGSCGPGSRPEKVQGRVPLADFTSGRAAAGYTCNTEQVAHFGNTGGYRTYAYTDPAG